MSSPERAILCHIDVYGGIVCLGRKPEVPVMSQTEHGGSIEVHIPRKGSRVRRGLNRDYGRVRATIGQRHALRTEREARRDLPSTIGDQIRAERDVSMEAVSARYVQRECNGPTARNLDRDRSTRKNVRNLGSALAERPLDTKPC